MGIKHPWKPNYSTAVAAAVSDAFASYASEKQPIKRYKIPATNTKEGKKRLREYYAALGRFVTEFSAVELAVSRTLWKYSSAPEKICRVVFSGTKIEQGATFIKQFAEALDADEDVRKDLENVLQQAGIINGVRNLILHHGVNEIAEGNAYVTDALKTKGEPVMLPIPTTDLENMIRDLRKIAYHLNYNHLGRAAPRAITNHLALLNALESPWRYKRPGPPSEQKKGSGRRNRRRRKRA